MFKLMILTGAMIAGAAHAQTELGTTPSAAVEPDPNPSRSPAAEDRAGQAPVGEQDAQRSATVQSPVDPVSPNEQVANDEAEKLCAAKRADGSTAPCPAPKSAQPTVPQGSKPEHAHGHEH